MKQKKFNLFKPYLKFILLSTLLVIMIYLTNPSHDKSCMFSEFNTYSNSSLSNDYFRFFNKCYVQTTRIICYEQEISCNGGILGIGQSCIELREKKTKCDMVKTEVCFNIKTGERC